MTEPAKLYAVRIVSFSAYKEVHGRNPEGKYVGKCRWAHGELYRWEPSWIDDAHLFPEYLLAADLEAQVQHLEQDAGLTTEIVCLREERP